MEPGALRGCDSADLERRVMAAVKASDARGDPPPRCAVELGLLAQEKGLRLPSLELAAVLVSNLCFAHNTPALWKLLDQAVASRLVSPLQTLALLTPRVVPHRRAQPEAYRLYLELLSRYALSSESPNCRDVTAKSINDALELSHTYGVQQTEFGHAVVLFVLSVTKILIDCTFEDCGLPFLSTDKHQKLYLTEGQRDMDLDVKGSSNDKRHEHRESLRRTNTLMAIEVAEKITANKKAHIILRLVYLNMPEKFNDLLQRLRRIEVYKLELNSYVPTRNVVDSLLANVQKATNAQHCLEKCQLMRVLIGTRPSSLLTCNIFGAGKAACWIPLDMFMENAVDGRHLYAISAIEVLTELTKTLQVINRATWQETFQALWISALRLVQRAREPLEGPLPHLDARLCMLLAIVPLSIAPLVKADNEMVGSEGNKVNLRRQGLVSSLQLLGQFSGLLSPPSAVVSVANTAASKAVVFLSNMKSGSANHNIAGQNGSTIKAVGNMLHLIVEACIARNLIDSSAYFWPGYVVPCGPSKDPLFIQESPWSTFMEGAPLTGALKNALVTTPASSKAEVEKLYLVALTGSEEERSAASKILCGASFVRGWNIQEHVVKLVVKLLSPPLPPESSAPGTGNHYTAHTSMLGSILSEVACIDSVHILSLYGMVPEIAAALMPICEAFGSLAPPSNQKFSDENSVYSVFSFAFLSLLRLWKFYTPPHEHCILGYGASVGVELTLDYLLLLHNSRVALQSSSATSQASNSTDQSNGSHFLAIYLDSFPKLRAWYFQNQACIASTLPGLCNKNSIHQVASKILYMICRKMTKGGMVPGNTLSPSSGSTSGSPVNSKEDAYLKLTLPAWEVLEAVPIVLEALLTACAYGRISPRDLTTGLRDLVDFLPASIAIIVSYFSAEITRGIWKPVPLNGTDWPSPAANLLSIESEVKEILVSAGVLVHSCYPRGMAPMLPLPMAALISLTITFKLDKSSECIQGVIGQALELCAGNSSWPSMPIVGALWTQKARRWHNFIVLSCSRAPFGRDDDAVVQLIRSCFSSFLGHSVGDSNIAANRGVIGLLGQSITDQGFLLPVAPGFLYIRSCRMFHDINYVSRVILKLVIEWAHKLANKRGFSGPACLRSCRTSLGAAASGVQQVAYLAASLLCIAGGLKLVQLLYEEALPILLLSDGQNRSGSAEPVCCILEGYAFAYVLIFIGSFAWGVGDTSLAYASVYSSKRARVIGRHMDFMAGVAEGKILLGCNPLTWKAYVLCFISLLVDFVPQWVPEVKVETLTKLAGGLRRWDEHDLALLLLERGGPAAMEAVVESML